MNNNFIIALVAIALSALLLVGCVREPSTSDLAGLYTAREFSSPLILLKPDSSYVSVGPDDLDCGRWEFLENNVLYKLSLTHEYKRDKNGYIYFHVFSGLSTIFSTDTICCHEEEMEFPWDTLYTDGRSSKNYKYDYKTEDLYRNIPQHKKIIDGFVGKFTLRPKRTVLFSCRLDDHPRLDRVPVAGVSNSYFTLSDLGGSYCFRFKEWRRDTDPRSPSSAPMWYESHLPQGISEFLAFDRGNMFVLYRDGTAVWLHCGPEADGHTPGPADTASYLVARNFPVAGDAEASALLDVIRDCLLSGRSVVAGSERGFALAGSIPPDKEGLFGRMLGSTFKTSPSVMLKYINSLMYTPSEDKYITNPTVYSSLHYYNGEMMLNFTGRYVPGWEAGSELYWYNKDWKLDGRPLVIPARPHATGIYRKDYTGLRELVAADGLVLSVRCKSADMSGRSRLSYAYSVPTPMGPCPPACGPFL